MWAEDPAPMRCISRDTGCQNPQDWCAPERGPQASDAEKRVTARAPPHYQRENREIRDEIKRDVGADGVRNMPRDPRGEQKRSQEPAIDNSAVNPRRTDGLLRHPHRLNHAASLTSFPDCGPSESIVGIPDRCRR